MISSVIKESIAPFIQNKLDPSVYLRAPELEVVAKPLFWQKFLKDDSIFIRGNFPLYQLKAPFDWTANPQHEISWNLYFHGLYFIGTIHEGIFRLVPSESEKRDAISFLQQAIFSYFDFLDANPPGSSNIVWDDHSTAYRASYLCIAYANLLANEMNVIEKSRFKQVMHLHADVLTSYLDSKKWQQSNHTIFQLEGLVDIALTFFKNTKQGLTCISKCRECFVSYIRGSVSLVDGTTKEHSLFYHAFVMERIRNHYDYLRANGVDPEIDVVQILKNMNRFLWLIMPKQGLVPAIGDTKYQMFINRKYYNTFLVPPYVDDDIQFLQRLRPHPVSLKYLTEFNEDGYFVFRDLVRLEDGLLSIFLEKKSVGPHGHMDGGGFVSYIAGIPVFIDSGGPYRYRDPLRYSYFQTQLAHNTVIVGGPLKYQSEILHSINGRNYAAVLSVAQMGDGIWWYRTFVQVASDYIFCVDLILTSGAQVPAQVRYHLAPEARMVIRTTADILLRIDHHELSLSFVGMPDRTTEVLEFDPIVFPAPDQHLALITKEDGQFEHGNMLCYPISAFLPLVMTCRVGSAPACCISYGKEMCNILIPKTKYFSGGNFTINWSLSGDKPQCAINFQLE